jgi:hypothetical protein
MVPLAPTDFHPPGIVDDECCRLVSNVDEADLVAFVQGAGFDEANIRTPALGSTVTYMALTSAQRATALAAGAGATPSDGKCYAQVFDKVVGSTWEPA